VAAVVSEAGASDCWAVLTALAERRLAQRSRELQRAQQVVEGLQASLDRVCRLQEDYRLGSRAQQDSPRLMADNRNDACFQQNLQSLGLQVAGELVSARARRDDARAGLTAAEEEVRKGQELQKRAAAARLAQAQRLESARLDEWATLNHAREAGGDEWNP
jgi:flagellar export protein FliJ